MKKLFLLGLLVITNFFIYGQRVEDIINAKEAERIEKILSADEMMGRKTGTPGIAKASYFIAEEFKAAGLQPFGNQLGFEQQFTMLRIALSAKSLVSGKDTPARVKVEDLK